MYFTAVEEGRIQSAIEQVEARTGVQVLAAVIGKADHYPEAPWRAFALAASLASLVLAIQAALDPPWIAPVHAAFYAIAVLGVGAAAALATMLLPPLARLFIPSARLEGEVEQYARGYFLEREVFGTRERTGILVLVSLFERKIAILPDTGLADRLPAGALAAVVAQMRPQLSRGARFAALSAGLNALERTLLAAGFRGAPGAPDEIPTELVQGGGVDE
jgi:putative membrane protein